MLDVSDNPYAACVGSHAVCVLTDWDEFKRWDYHSCMIHVDSACNKASALGMARVYAAYWLILLQPAS